MMITEEQLRAHELEAREMLVDDFRFNTASTVLQYISEIRRLRAALEFYADEDNYFAKFDPNKECPVMWDDGATARRALGREP